MKQLIEKAKEKGFWKNLKIASDGFIHPIDKYVWMCLLQKWLRDEHNIFVEISWYDDCFNTEITVEETARLEGRGEYKTYEQALEEALTKALELI